MNEIRKTYPLLMILFLVAVFGFTNFAVAGDKEIEKEIKTLGFSQLRVRSHKDLARLEFIENEIGIMSSNLATLKYYLGGYSNAFDNCDLSHRWLEPNKGDFT